MKLVKNAKKKRIIALVLTIALSIGMIQLPQFALKVQAATTMVISCVEDDSGKHFVASGFTATAGTAGVSNGEGYAQLVNNVKTDKWCVTSLGNPTYVEFYSDKPIVPVGYIMTIGGDTNTFQGRNPKSWKVLAKVNENDSEWATLADVTDNTDMSTENYYDCKFAIDDNTTAYQYFRLEISAIREGTCFQLAEFQFMVSPDKYDLSYCSIEGLAENYDYNDGKIIPISYTVTNCERDEVSADQYTATITNSNGEAVQSVTTNGTYTLTVTGKSAYNGTLSRIFHVVGVLPGDGTEESPYLISNIDEWNTFAENINCGSRLNAYYKLTDNIGTDKAPVTTTVGTVSGSKQGVAFAGTFDGDGYTINVNITNTDDSGTAPFRYISGATIKNVKVTGTVNGTMHCAGLVGFAASGTDCTISNCEVAASVNCGGSSHCGGILGHGLSSTTTISNCLFSGIISGSTSDTGIIYGWGDSGGSHILINCLSAGKYSTCSGVNLLRMAGGTDIITNCYRKSDHGYQGTYAGSYTADELATALNSDGREWQVDGDNVVPIMVKDSYRIQGGTITIDGLADSYAYNNGETIPISYTVKDCNGNTIGKDYYSAAITNKKGESVTSVTSKGIYTLTITGLSPYSGKLNKTFYVVTEGNIPLAYETITMSNGTYEVIDDMAISERIVISGTVTLLIDEGFTLTASKGICVADGNKLIIEGSGTLNATGTNDNAGIGSNKGGAHGEIIINSGTVNASGPDYAAGIGGGYNNSLSENSRITINGGIVNAIAGRAAAAIGGGWNYSSIDPKGNPGTIIINGGQVTAKKGTSGNTGIGGGGNNQSNSGELTLNWTDEKDFVFADSYAISSITFSKIFVLEENDEIATTGNIGGKKIVPGAQKDLTYAELSGVKDSYIYKNGETIDIAYTVTDSKGIELTKGTHYTAVITDSSNNEVTNVSTVGQYTLTITGISPYINSIVKRFGVRTLSGEGTEESPILLASVDDWNEFVGLINNGFNNDSYFKMTDDIGTESAPVTNMAGLDSDHCFSGNFDGNWKTLTVNLTSGENYLAPFRYIRNAEIHHLNVDGKIEITGMCAGSIASYNLVGTSAINYCSSTVAITTYYMSGTDNTGYHGGMVGKNDGTLNFNNCVFKGKLIGNRQSNGGFVGSSWESNFTDCIFAPTELTMWSGRSYTFSSGKHYSFSRCYYICTFGEEQGEKAYNSAEEAENDGLTDYVEVNICGTTVYTIKDIELTDFAKDEEGRYLISCASDLYNLALYVDQGNNCKGLTFLLTDDIDYTGRNDFRCIGGYSTQDTTDFRGTFDGDGHTISGIKVWNHYNWNGLFGKVIYPGIVENLILADCEFSGGIWLGGIVGNCSGDIINCHVLDSVKLIGGVGTNYIGGIAGESYGLIDSCTSAVSISGVNSYGGGIAGKIYSKSEDLDGVIKCLSIGVSLSEKKANAGAVVGCNEEDRPATLEDNYYSRCTVGEETTGIGCSMADLTRKAEPLNGYIVTVFKDIKADDDNKAYGSSPYYLYNANDTVTLNYYGLPGYTAEYIVTKDGTDPAETITVNADNTFTMPAANVSVKAVLKKDITYTAVTVGEIQDQVYTGTEITLDVVVKDGETTLTKDTDYTVSYSNNTEVGTATVTLTGIGDYKGSRTVTFAIKYKISFLAGEGSGSMDDVLVGSGDYELPSCKFNPPSDKVLKCWSVKIGDAEPVLKNAGDKVGITANTTITALWISHTHSFSYSVNGGVITATCIETIGDCSLVDKKITFELIKPKKTVYDDGKAVTATLTGLDEFNTVTGLNISVSDIKYALESGNALDAAPSDAGNYTASISLGSGENIVTASVSYAIAPKAVTISGLSVSDKVYDGTVTATYKGTVVINGKADGDDLCVVAGDAEFADAKAETNKIVSFTGWSLGGTAAGNYVLSAQPASVTASITKKQATVKAKDQTVKVDESIASGVSQAELSGQVEGHTLTAVTLSGNTTAVGTTSVTPSAATIKNGDEDVTENYDITYTAGTLTVTTKTAVVTLAPALISDLTYTGVLQNLVTAGTADTKMEYSLDGTNFSETIPQGKNAGTYKVYYRAKADSKHDESEICSIDVTMGKASLTITANPKSIVYGNGPANAGVTYAGFVNNETYSVLTGTLDYEYNYTLYGNVGQYTIKPKGLTSDNYNISFAAGTLTVTKKTVVLTWSTESFTYNGSAQAPTVTVTGTVNNDEIGATVSGAKTDAGTGYTATASALIGTKAGNYQLPENNTCEFTINASSNVPGKPASTMSVAYSVKKVSDISLSGNWAWDDNDKNTALVVGTAVNAKAVYVGTDAGNYTEASKTVIIAITRIACTHEGCETEVKDAKVATCTEAGYTGDTYCKTCGTKILSGTVINPLGHTYGTATYVWSTDNKTCTATKICTREGCTDSETDHKVTETVNTTSEVTKQPTCEGKGVKTYTATFTKTGFSKQTKTVDIDPTGHSYGTATYTWSSDNKTCTAIKVCIHTGCSDSLAGHKITETVNTTSTVTTEPTCEGKGVRTYTATFTKKGFAKQTKNVDIDPTGHSYGTATYTWSSDNKTCTAIKVCIHTGCSDSLAGHKITETVNTTSTVTTEPTCEGKGVRTYTATFTKEGFAKQTKNVDIDATGHSYGTATYTWSADNKTCTATKVCTHTGCSDSLTGHKVTETVNTTSSVTTQPTCEGKGVRTYTATFTKEGFAKQTKNVDIDPTGHSYGTATYAWSADNKTCTATKVCTHTGCSDSLTGHKVTETVNTTSSVTTQPTCEGKGVRTYTATFTKEGFAKQTKNVDIDPTGHAYGTATYAWSADNKTCTATKVCTHTGCAESLAGHKITEIANTTNTVTKEPTCEGKGVRTYTATFTNEGFTTQTKNVDIDATGHSYGTATYTWSADNKTCTATKVCTHTGCSDSLTGHKVTETVNTTSSVTTQPTCEGKGVRTYTATFTKEGFAKQTKNVDIDPTGHTYGTATYAWSADNKTCTATKVCTHTGCSESLAGHKITETVNTTSSVTTQPTCEGKGVRTYTATFTKGGFATQTKTEDIDALGHRWNEGEITKPATAAEDGIKTYTCLVCLQTRTETISATGVEITGQPADITADEGSAVNFSVTAAGAELKFQWQTSKDGGSTWVNSKMTGYNTATLTVNAIIERNGYKFRCVVTDKSGKSITSTVATLTVKKVATTGPSISGQPADVTAEENATVKFSVTAAGAELKFQWQTSKDGGSTWVNSKMSGYNTATLTVNAIIERNGYKFRCVVTDKSGKTATSNAATLTVKKATTGPSISGQPADITAEENAIVKFSVTVSGTELKYQWQTSKDGGKSWINSGMTGYSTSTLTVNAIIERNGYKFRCVVTDKSGKTATSTVATLTVKKVATTGPSISGQPADITVEENATVKFSVTASGEGLKYQWQTSKDGGKSWVNSGMSGYSTSTLTVNAIIERNGYKFRCVVTDKSGKSATSNAATLTVKKATTGPSISGQPADITAEENANVKFSVTASGEGLKYQWQTSKDGGKSWVNSGMSGYSTSTLTVNAIIDRNGYKFRCVVTDKSGKSATSNAATLTVKKSETPTGPQITSQPTNVTTKAGNTVTFSVSATGTELKYQWQTSKDGGKNWVNSGMTGYNTNTLTVSAIIERNGYQFRCIVTDKSGAAVTSNAAALTVNK